MTLKNEAQLKKFLADKCAQAVKDTKDTVYKKFAENLDKFYSEYKPKEYIRTGALEGSLESTDVIRYGNQHVSVAEAEVGFNVPSYEHGWVRLQSGDYDWSSWSDEKVLDVVMQDALPHGGYEDGTAIWTQSMRELGEKNGINKILKQELKKQGL